MEDRILIFQVVDKKTKTKYYNFLVLDGHGGKEVVEYVKNNFETIFKVTLLKHKSVKNIIKQVFYQLDKEIQSKKYASGTTVSLLLIVQKEQKIETWIANVGDSTIYGFKEKGINTKEEKQIQKLSIDHNAKNKKEKKRIDKLNQTLTLDKKYHFIQNYIAFKNKKEIYEMLAITRAIGDHNFRPAVISEPTIKKLRTKYDIIVLASDGLWDVLNGSSLLREIKKTSKWKNSAETINNWRNETFPQHDNSSLIIVYLSFQPL